MTDDKSAQGFRRGEPGIRTQCISLWPCTSYLFLLPGFYFVHLCSISSFLLHLIFLMSSKALLLCALEQVMGPEFACTPLLFHFHFLLGHYSHGLINLGIKFTTSPFFWVLGLYLTVHWAFSTWALLHWKSNSLSASLRTKINMFLCFQHAGFTIS